MSEEDGDVPKPRYCAYDKTRICGPDCAAYQPEAFGVITEPFLDETDPLKQFNWRRVTKVKGPNCGRDNFLITVEIVEEVLK